MLNVLFLQDGFTIKAFNVPLCHYLFILKVMQDFSVICKKLQLFFWEHFTTSPFCCPDLSDVGLKFGLRTYLQKSIFDEIKQQLYCLPAVFQLSVCQKGSGGNPTLLHLCFNTAT